MLVASRTSLPRRSDATQERKRVIRCPLPTRSTVIYLLLFSLVPFASARDKDPKGWKLVWSDDFKQPNGSAPDPAKWDYALGGNGWGNQELETYTDRRNNSHIEHGKLVITARRENFTGKDGIKREYTSARLVTRGKFAQQYGRFEARIKIPFGQGIWPAFWMLGDRGEWPERGEIDIMENIGKEPRTVHGTIHGPGYSGEHGIGAPYAIKTGRFADKFHIYAVEWEPNLIRFYVDSHLYKTITPADLPAGTKWVYDEPFYMLLNVAVGGGWPGYPDATSTYPQKMQVDYVRVYQRPEMKKVQE
jgi:beta-glucanase (GH16 family)